MLKSTAHASTTAPAAPASNGGAAIPASRNGTKREARPARGRLAKAIRWLHTYVSMFGLLSVLFFSITGITLNHPDWFFDGAQSLRYEEGQVDRAWLGGPEGDDAEADPSGVARLEIVEHLRAAHGIRGALAEFTADEFECTVAFKGPGYSADAYIDRETGAYTLTESYAGFVAVMNDLHKGRDSGAGWKWLIDISAAVLALASATGLLLMIFIKKRRRSGLITAGVGGALLLLVYFVFVP
ncbi:MAG: PepSY-associated TM helix domain-containing protein [Candidatus Hydrogenedentes bacterium]|nr:PepSY-associated TM helix domain-containing protein [Candidatus Hydrogenedentota bacterium]